MSRTRRYVAPRPKKMKPVLGAGWCSQCNQLQAMYKVPIHGNVLHGTWHCRTCGTRHGSSLLVTKGGQSLSGHKAQVIYDMLNPPPIPANFKCHPTVTNLYVCCDCEKEGKSHAIVEESAGYTEEGSYWGGGVPKHIRRCTGCLKFDGPWVSAKHVGDCW